MVWDRVSGVEIVVQGLSGLSWFSLLCFWSVYNTLYNAIIIKPLEMKGLISSTSLL